MYVTVCVTHAMFTSVIIICKHVLSFMGLGAVQRDCENMRRQWVMDGKETKDEIAFQEAQRKKYRARKQWVWDN